MLSGHKKPSVCKFFEAVDSFVDKNFRENLTSFKGRISRECVSNTLIALMRGKHLAFYFNQFQIRPDDARV